MAFNLKTNIDDYYSQISEKKKEFIEQSKPKTDAQYLQNVPQPVSSNRYVPIEQKIPTNIQIKRPNETNVVDNIPQVISNNRYVPKEQKIPTNIQIEKANQIDVTQLESEYSVKGIQEVDFFGEVYANGFISRMTQTQLKPNTTNLGPNEGAVNFFNDNNSKGFTRNMSQTEIQPNSTNLGPNEGAVDYFSNNNANGFVRNMSQTEIQPNTTTLGPNEGAVDYFSNNNANGFVRNMSTTLIKPETTNLGPNPGAVDYFNNNNADGFIRNMNTTLIKPSTTTLGPNPGAVDYFSNNNAEGFVRNMSTTLIKPDTTQLGPNPGAVNFFNDNNARGFVRNMSTTLIDPTTSNLGPNPGAVDYFSNRSAEGFTRNMTTTLIDPTTTELGPNEGAVDYFSNRNSTGFIRNMTTTLIDPTTTELGPNPGAVNFFNDNNSDGFVRNMSTTLIKPNTTFLGPNEGAVDYFSNNNAEGFVRNMSTTLIKPETTFLGPNEGSVENFIREFSQSVLATKTSPLGRITEVNFINDINAKGFTPNFTTTELQVDTTTFGWGGGGSQAPSVRGFLKYFGNNSNQSRLLSFIGASQYDRDPSLTLLDNKESILKSDASPFAYIKYGDGAVQREPLLTFLTAGKKTKITPTSPIGLVYNKYNLPGAAHQIDYIDQPLIVRGIQRKGKYENQRWGGALNDKLSVGNFAPLRYLSILGRSILRNSKFAISSRGLLFIVKQQLLQITNPAVESDGAFRPTWTYDPTSTLIGSGISKRHGLGDVVGGAVGILSDDYEKLIKRRNNQTDKIIRPSQTSGLLARAGAQALTTENRLVSLYKELMNSDSVARGSEISLLSVNIGGPSSIFGILGTPIRRASVTNQDSDGNKIENKYLPTKQYLTSPILLNKVQPPNSLSYNLDEERKTVGPSGQNTFSSDKVNEDLTFPSASEEFVRTIQDSNGNILENKFLPTKQYLTSPILLNKVQPPNSLSYNLDEEKKIVGPSGQNTFSSEKVNEDLTFPTETEEFARNDVKPYTTHYISSLGKISGSLTYNEDTAKVNIDNFVSEKAEFNEPTFEYYDRLKDENNGPFKHKQPDDFDVFKYHSLSYGNIETAREIMGKDGRRDIRDFRELLDKDNTKTFSIDPEKINGYGTHNMHTKGIVPDAGIPERDRSDPYNEGSWLSWNGESDFITIKIGDIRIRAINVGFNVSQAISWGSSKTIGRADNIFSFEGIGRNGQLDFHVVAESSGDLEKCIKKLNDISRLTMPTFGEVTTNGLLNAPITTIQVGNIYTRNVAINNVGFTVDMAMPWDIDVEQPRKVDVSVGFDEIMTLSKIPNKPNYGYDTVFGAAKKPEKK